MVLTPSDTAADRLRAASPVVDALGDAWIVGGAVRDALLGRPAGKDLDVVDPADGVALARRLQEAFGGELVIHDRFGTATLSSGDWSVDVATARGERYETPGALPVVTVPAPLSDDLRRRDFTVNAVALRGDGEMLPFPGALDDLADGHLRVLHEGSFLDDPTRLYRLARYAARLGFMVDADTERLAREAFAAGAPATAGAARIGNEVLLILGEDPPVALTALEHLRLLGADVPEVDAEVVRRAVALLPDERDHVPLLLAAIFGGVPEGWHVANPGPVNDASSGVEDLAAAMRSADRASDLHRLLRRRSDEAVALAGAVGAEDEARRWFAELRDISLPISGDDLIAAGVPQGPEIGRRLDAALAKRLDEGVTDRDALLAAALTAERP